MKKVIILAVVLGMIFGLVAAFFWQSNIKSIISINDQNEDADQKILVNSFDSCVHAGYPVQESFPRRCATSDGKIYSEKVGEVEYDIVLDSPLPNTTLQSPFEITGQATGTWFFEASFTVELIDSEGEVISEGILTAKGEWMTEELVEFNGELEYEGSGEGELILKSANPSGLPENQKIFSIPVKY